MGVPAFFRWLTRKYPSVIVHCLEEKPRDFDGVEQNVDTSEPNPNGVEFDNLYLDMNGIIHPCTHPEDKPAPKNEDEMMIAIFECIDRLFRIVRPRKILYMAIDGVAPRAKMNQQRSRRFRASKETAEKIIEVARIREELAAKGAILPPEKEKGEHFDSNCITPGTPFMARLSDCLHYYIHARMNEDPGWKNIKVILSDANVPGEGEHKIMDFIRRQRAQPDHDPNTQHCLCGADADLIMLGLATHEPNFTIIREEFQPFKPRPCELCGQLGHEMKECEGLESEQVVEKPQFSAGQAFIFVRLNVLREYLEKELSMPNLPFEYDFERLIDDWVFMCFFVGNDFLPHLPSLEIREDAIDRLVSLYKKTVYRTGGYLTDSGTVNLDRVQLIMSDLGDMEDEIFRKRQDREVSFKLRDKAKKQRMKRMREFQPSWVPKGQFEPQALGQGRQVPSIVNPRQEARNMRVEGMNVERAASEGAGAGAQSSADQKRVKRKLDESDEEEETPDEVRLWESGCKDRYYESKFDVGPDNIAFRHRVGHEYVQGLCWVLQYYYQGCSSWKWYYPYHYAPFASDFVNVADVNSKFEIGTEPFKPLEQLMGVFPAASSGHVPGPWATLMSDPNSSIIDFYPEDFKIDLNGKKFAWQGVALLPFVDENRLRKALAPLYKDLTPAEIARNVRGSDRLYISGSHPKYTSLRSISITEEKETGFLIDGVRGTVGRSQSCVKVNASIESPVFGLPVIHCNDTVCVEFSDPVYPEDYIFLAHRLKGAVAPPRILKPGEDDSRSQNWRPVIGMVPSTQRAFMTGAGHRMLNHSVNRSDGYNSVPPPHSLGGSSDRNQPLGRYVRPPGWQDRSDRNHYGQSNQYNRDRNYQQQQRRGGHGPPSLPSFPRNGSRGGYQSARAGYHTSTRGGSGGSRGSGGGSRGSGGGSRGGGGGSRGYETGNDYRSGSQSGYQSGKGSYQSQTRTAYSTAEPVGNSSGAGYQSGGSGYQSGGSGYQSGGSGYQSGGSGYQTGGSSYQTGRRDGFGNKGGRGRYPPSNSYGSHSSGSSDRRDRGSQQGNYSRLPNRR